MKPYTKKQLPLWKKASNNCKKNVSIMAVKKSAGILIYRFMNKQLQVLLAHPGGPLWKNKDAGAWSIPKGEFADDEDPLEAANREFTEETGIALYGGFTELTPVKQKSGKLVYAWALEFDIDASAVQSNVFEMEWPPKSGKLKRFPEIERAEWFSVEEAKQKILPAQASFIDELVSKTGASI
jgi:predicted NUDIX family NTP pyrophosphohydrolase